MIDRASEERLKSSIDIVEIISNYIELKKAGANFKANCPFHGEKTASFVVSPQKQIFHCFGCSIGGDAIEFVKQYEKLSYPEALEKIASIMNFSLTYSKGGGSFNEVRRVLEQVQSWYSKNLDSSQIARDYLKNRAISQQSIEEFGIGYVGKSHELINFLSSNFLSLQKAQEAGVIAQRESGGYYARLTERITFPIYSPSGAIVGFGGRTITNHPAKYINSPQTKLFNKSQLLYGYSKAKEHIYKNKKLIVCEGYLDVILLHQAGFKEAVATLGTALTNEHLPILRKGEPQIILAYDGDRAGIEAGLKASIMLTHSGFDGSVVLFPNGQDPADMVAKGKIDEVASLLRGGDGLISFVINMLSRKYDLKNPKAKESAFEEIKRYLDGLTPILRESYIPQVSTILGVSPALFGSKIENVKPKLATPKEDIAQLSILKTLLENRELIDTMLEVIEPSMFGNYSTLLEAIIKDDKDNPTLQGLMIDDNIKVMKEDEFKRALNSFLFAFYSKKLKSIISDNSLPLIKKSFLIRKIKMDILPRLREGELVYFL
jgi:DNA primase